MHHAKNDYLMLTLWLNQNYKNTLPKLTNHSIGCDGVVINH